MCFMRILYMYKYSNYVEKNIIPNIVYNYSFNITQGNISMGYPSLSLNLRQRSCRSRTLVSSIRSQEQCEIYTTPTRVETVT